MRNHLILTNSADDHVSCQTGGRKERIWQFGLREASTKVPGSRLRASASVSSARSDVLNASSARIPLRHQQSLPFFIGTEDPIFTTEMTYRDSHKLTIDTLIDGNPPWCAPHPPTPPHPTQVNAGM